MGGQPCAAHGPVRLGLPQATARSPRPDASGPARALAWRYPYLVVAVPPPEHSCGGPATGSKLAPTNIKGESQQKAMRGLGEAPSTCARREARVARIGMPLCGSIRAPALELPLPPRVPVAFCSGCFLPCPSSHPSSNSSSFVFSSSYYLLLLVPFPSLPRPAPSSTLQGPRAFSLGRRPGAVQF